jgi:hypothetical protein
MPRRSVFTSAAILAVVLPSLSSAIFAQQGVTGIRALTEATLAEAVRLASTDAGANQVVAFGLPVAAFTNAHGMDAIVGDRALNRRFDAIIDGPYRINIVSPFIAAAMRVAEAKRKYEDPPHLSIASLNAEKVIVNVRPGRNFTNFGVIEAMVIKRGGQIVRPLKSNVTPTVVQNRMGASAAAADGEFTFDFSTFDPSDGVVLVLIGKSGNFEWEMSAKELAQLR